MNTNLLSVSQICLASPGTSVLFTSEKAEVRNKEGALVMEAAREGGVYALKATTHAEANSAVVVEASPAVADKSEQELWHCRLGHQSEGGMKKLKASGAVSGLDKLKPGEDGGLCPGCMQGKAHREAFGRKATERSKSSQPLERVHADLLGPLPRSIAGAQYLLLIVDEYTRFTFAACLAHKGDAAEKIIEWCRSAVVQKGTSLKEFHSDGGGEFMPNELRSFFRAAGVTATMTAARYATA
jgi:hypothetical protein